MLRSLFILTLVLSLGSPAAMGQAPKGKAALEFQWDNVLPVWIKLNQDFEYSDSADEAYLQLMQPETWKAVKQNEFAFRDAKLEAHKRLKTLVEGADTERVFVLKSANVSLGKYDFDLKGFPITEMGDTYYWYTSSRYSNGFPQSFSVYFTNTKPFALVKMDPDVAKKLIEDRTDRFGNVKRSAAAEIRFQLEGLKEKKGSGLNATIQSVTIYNDSNKLKPIAHLDASVVSAVDEAKPGE